MFRDIPGRQGPWLEFAAHIDERADPNGNRPEIQAEPTDLTL